MDPQSIFLIVCLLCYHSESTPQRFLKTFTFEELVPLQPDYLPERLMVTWISDNEYTYTDNKLLAIRKQNVATDMTTTLINTSDMQRLNSYITTTFSEDEEYLLLLANKQKGNTWESVRGIFYSSCLSSSPSSECNLQCCTYISFSVYRYSFLAEYYVYNLVTKQITKINDGILQMAIWGKGHSLAYVKENNVYYLPDVSNPAHVITLTNEGVPGQVYFGVADWIYEEEIFNSAKALWFSPQGTFLAVASFNDVNVESAVYPYYGKSSDFDNQYPEMVSFKYPKAGRTNPTVGLRVFMANNPASDAWNIPAPIDIVGTDNILGRVNWISDSNLLVLWLNRRQNVSALIKCDLILDKCNIVREQVEPNGWININDVYLDDSGNRMVELTPTGYKNKRYYHAALFDFSTRLTEDLTPVNTTVLDILGWNANKGTLFYIIAPKDTPWKRELWVNKNGYHQCISCRESSCHTTSGQFSTDLGYGILRCSASYSPNRIFLYSSKDDSMKLLIDNGRLAKKLNQYNLPMTLFNKIYLQEGVEAHIRLTLPPNISKANKYPMVIRVYAGPGTSMVKDTFEPEYYNLFLATNKSYIIGAIDVRGSSAMDVDSMFAVNNALGTVEITDTLESIRKILKMYSFIDPERVAVWGWSYGGFTSSLMLMKDQQKTLACVASVAPVTSWLYYDTMYTERYMSTPQDNPLGYQRSDLMLSAEKVRGREYLLIHGTNDDNVHYQHSLHLAKALQHADIDFEQMSYTDENHSLLGVTRHLYHTLNHFWERCFDRK